MSVLSLLLVSVRLALEVAVGDLAAEGDGCSPLFSCKQFLSPAPNSIRNANLDRLSSGSLGDGSDMHVVPSVMMTSPSMFVSSSPSSASATLHECHRFALCLRRRRLPFLPRFCSNRASRTLVALFATFLNKSQIYSKRNHHRKDLSLFLEFLVDFFQLRRGVDRLCISERVRRGLSDDWRSLQTTFSVKADNHLKKHEPAH